MMRFSSAVLFLTSLILLSSCGVPKDEHAAVVASRDSLQQIVNTQHTTIADLNSGITTLSRDILSRENELQRRTRERDSLQRVLDDTRGTYNTLKSNSSAEIQELLDRVEKMRTDLATREQRLQEVEQKLRARDSTMNALRQRLSDALLGFRESGLTVDVRNGRVYVSLSNQLLFKSGSTSIDKRGLEALREVATVLKTQPDIAILVEGHTDNVPVTGGGRFQDNWDLSVLRSTEVIRFLASEGLDPHRITASGRGENEPLQPGDTPEARAQNRRTEIILTPKLEELFEVIRN